VLWVERLHLGIVSTLRAARAHPGDRRGARPLPFVDMALSLIGNTMQCLGDCRLVGTRGISQKFPNPVNANAVDHTSITLVAMIPDALKNFRGCGLGL
jgi:hypothetical protein